jgi:hypothetical protein
VNSDIIKTIIYKAFTINRWNPKIPTSFMVDIMNIYKETMNWFNTHIKRIYTTNIYDNTILVPIFTPYIQVSADVANEYTMTCSFYHLLKLDEMGSIFVKYILDKRICKKLLCIEKIFGLKPEQEPLVPLSDHDASTIGNILTEYLRSNRNLLI